MAFSVVSSYGGINKATVGGTSASAGLTWTAALAATANTTFVVAAVAFDSRTLIDASTNEVLNVTGGGATWVKVGEWTNSTGVTGGGQGVAVFYAAPTAAMTLSTLLVAQLDVVGLTVGAAVTSFKFEKSAGAGISVAALVAGLGDGVSIGPITITSLANQEYLFFSGAGTDDTAGASFVEMTNYTALTRQTTGTTQATACTVRGAYRILTGTTDTYNPSSNLRTYAQLYAAFYEVAGAATQTLTAGLDAQLLNSLTLTGLLDAVLQKQMSATVGADAVLQKALTTTTSADAIIQKAIAAAASLDAALLKQQSKTTTIDATFLASLSTTALLDALLARTVSITTSLDAHFAPPAIALITFIDAQLARSIAATLVIDAIMASSWRRQAATTADWTATIPVDG